MPRCIAQRQARTTSKAGSDRLPAYAEELAGFHRAFSAELRALVASLPLSPEMRVLDVGCGDGFYLDIFADRLTARGGVVGLDINTGFLDLARERLSAHQGKCAIELVNGTLEDFPLGSGSYDIGWCAQSL